MKLNLEPLRNAIARLQEGLERCERDPSDAQIRDGLIQRFECTYELRHKTLKRYLEASSPTPEIYDSMPFQDLIRSGNEHGLLLAGYEIAPPHTSITTGITMGRRRVRR